MPLRLLAHVAQVAPRHPRRGARQRQQLCVAQVLRILAQDLGPARAERRSVRAEEC